MSEKKAFLQVKDLNVEYVTKEETVSAVNGVSFQLEKGKVLGLVVLFCACCRNRLQY